MMAIEETNFIFIANGMTSAISFKQLELFEMVNRSAFTGSKREKGT
jgi:hypothetical protein